MSSGFQQHFTPADIAMLDRILDRAALYNLPGSGAQQNRSEAAQFLIRSFQHGMINEGALYFALLNRQDKTMDQSGEATVEAPSQKSDTIPAFTAKGGYRYGRRVEPDGTWTIYHVFSGEQASHDSWNMAGLNVKTADRVLRLLNAPSKAA